MSEKLSADALKAKRAEELKAIIGKLAKGSSPAEVKKEFHALIKDSDAMEVAALEQSLIEGGMPVEEVQRLCEVHADVFKAGLERGQRADRMPGHPVHTYMAENKEARKRSGRLLQACFFGSLSAIKAAVEALKPIITHFERKENQLFPYLEQKGFTGPSKVMWGKHDEIRTVFKELDVETAGGTMSSVRRKSRDLVRRIRMMIFMEEKILFPNALKRLDDAEWASVRRGEDAIGFAWVRPGSEWDPALANPAAGKSMYANFEAAIAGAVPKPLSEIPLSVGSLPLDFLDRILKNLPLDLSFVDANDKVMYYSDSPHRVFPRSPGIIGRDVRNCHPQKSVDIVEKILQAFKNKEKDKADFWIEMNGRFIMISYKAIYDDGGAYLGTLEMSWDATDIRKLEGQRRLLDW